MIEKTANLSGRVRRVLWAVFLVSLPVTSFPFFPAVLGGKSTVRPLAIYPLIGLFVLVVLPRLFKIRLPRAFIPLFVFGLVALISAGLALTLGIPAFQGITALDRVVRNGMTLAIGAGFYLVVALIPEDREDLQFTLRWLLVGFAVALAWGSLQALYVVMPNSAGWRAYFEQLNDLQHLISTRNLQRRRVSGMAYEPSWFAEQICILVLPWLLTAVFRRYSAFRRFRGVQVEDVLLVWAVGILILTYSRGGVVIMFGLLVLSFLGWRAKSRESNHERKWGGLKRAGIAVGVITGLAAVILILGSQNQYFSRLWRFWTEGEGGTNYWAYIAFGQRFIYWEAALDIFEQYPVFGVGMGNYALVFEGALPDVPLYRYPEILELITPEKGGAVLLTPKNLFVRVLAETGMVGFAVFAGFLWVILGEGLRLSLLEDEETRFWGRAGVLGFAAACLVGFSTDSFATPNMWVLFGLVTAAGRVVDPLRTRSNCISCQELTGTGCS